VVPSELVMFVFVSELVITRMVSYYHPLNTPYFIST